MYYLFFKWRVRLAPQFVRVVPFLICLICQANFSFTFEMTNQCWKAISLHLCSHHGSGEFFFYLFSNNRLINGLYFYTKVIVWYVVLITWKLNNIGIIIVVKLKWYFFFWMERKRKGKRIIIKKKKGKGKERAERRSEGDACGVK